MNTVLRSHAQLGCRSMAIAGAALVLLAPMAMAQDESADGPHPAHIHVGTCAELGDVVAPLTDLVAMTGEREGSATAIPVKTGRSLVDLPLQDIIDGGHAINVHLSADQMDVYIACGDVGGMVRDEGGQQHFIFGMGEQNDSGHTGTAWLGSDGDRTEVNVTLTEPDEAE